jgi:hypothetical protein
MIVSRNVNMLHTGSHDYVIHVTDPDLDVLFEKHGGQVNVKIGRPETPGTEQQNRAAHALLTAFYVSGFASIPENCTLAEFKVRKKLEYGPVWEFEYNGQRARVPKSWADYSKQERAAFLDGLIAEIYQSGAFTASEKLREIINGMVEAV